MYTLFLHQNEYLNSDPEISMPFLPSRNDWLDLPNVDSVLPALGKILPTALVC